MLRFRTVLVLHDLCCLIVFSKTALPEVVSSKGEWIPLVEASVFVDGVG